jgi:hypothetical protein
MYLHVYINTFTYVYTYICIYVNILIYFHTGDVEALAVVSTSPDVLAVPFNKYAANFGTFLVILCNYVFDISYDYDNNSYNCSNRGYRHFKYMNIHLHFYVYLIFAYLYNYIYIDIDIDTCIVLIR